MGTIAARDCLRILELTEQVAAALVLAAVQGVELRQRQGELTLTAPVTAFCQNVRQRFAFLDEDRPLENDLRAAMAAIQQRTWELYDAA